ncbi:MAG TPA: 3'(2'),5'-bisphosphate nucleotidase CysQ [Polyangiaceae bacterium]|nr:3'(2'),5'-bisphosphate nucleotidase CysQ [Polyangiaceae bacterium]
MRDVLQTLLPIARAAADVISRVYRTPFDVDYKGPSDPVTVADREANELICAALRDRYPDVPIVAEESDPATFADFRSHRHVFFVDPLDGTREFVKRNGQFVVMIGLLADERALAGVIHVPDEDRAYAGVVGEGAFVVDADGSRRPIHTSGVSELPQARVVISRSHGHATAERALEVLSAASVSPLGSAGLKAAAVASGTADAYVATAHAGKRWDACAADALVHAAGGVFTDATGNPIDHRAPSLTNDRGVVASTRALHPQLLERVAPYIGRS